MSVILFKQNSSKIVSAKNKRASKARRGYERAARPHPERRPLGTSSVSEEDALNLLCDPKQKLSAPARRYLRGCRARALVMPLPTVRPFAVRLAEKLSSLKLTQVLRRRSQFAARAAGAKYKLDALSPNSRFRPALQAVQDANLRAFKAAEAEISARQLRATNQPPHDHYPHRTQS